MSGEISIEKLQQDRAANNVSPGDKIFLDFLAYSGTTLEDLQLATKREALKAKCEAAGNDITDEIFQFWSQNNALEGVKSPPCAVHAAIFAGWWDCFG